MSMLVTFIGELFVRIGSEMVFVNAWSLEYIFGVGEDGVACRDNSKQIRINPRFMLEDFDAVVGRVTTLGATKWTVQEVRAALEPALKNLLDHFEVDRGHLGTIVRVSKPHKARLRGDPNVDFEVRIADEGLGDLAAQNGEEAGETARRETECSAMVRVANVVSRIRA